MLNYALTWSMPEEQVPPTKFHLKRRSPKQINTTSLRQDRVRLIKNDRLHIHRRIDSLHQDSCTKIMEASQSLYPFQLAATINISIEDTFAKQGV